MRVLQFWWIILQQCVPMAKEVFIVIFFCSRINLESNKNLFHGSLDWLIPDFVYGILVQRSILVAELNFYPIPSPLPFLGAPKQILSLDTITAPMHHPSLHPCTAQLARHLPTQSPPPSWIICIRTTLYCCYILLNYQSVTKNKVSKSKAKGDFYFQALWSCTVQPQRPMLILWTMLKWQSSLIIDESGFFLPCFVS